MKTLAEIQQALKAPKEQKNEFGGYTYRSAEQILAEVKPLLGEHALILEDEIVEVGGRVYVKATATLQGLDAKATAYAREPQSRKGMDESQITGAASSYARKYALSGLFAIDDSRDDPDHKEPPAEIDAAKQLESATNLKQLAAIWKSLSPADKTKFAALKDELKMRLESDGG